MKSIAVNDKETEMISKFMLFLH